MFVVHLLSFAMVTPYEHVERSLVDTNGCPMLLFYTGQSPFSNFYNSPITLGTNTFHTAEHCYQSWKAAYFGDFVRREAILAEPRPAKAKFLARTIKNFDKAKWDLVAPRIMAYIVTEKFRQNPVAREKLLGTGGAIIVEATEFDPFWGSGLNIMDDSHVDFAKWRGFNVLGQILMNVRERLRKE